MTILVFAFKLERFTHPCS